VRLHSLEVTAFGPFTDTVSVDFDRLAGAGLFLLSGPTGAGKTSVLDAVCFALYGDVPGDRSTAKRLRSDQAPLEAAPRVVLEATLSGRRFRLTRSPGWERPKKRGSGMTPQQPSVVVQELVGGDWITHTTRIDEAGHLVSGLLGMTLTQFTQVAMLPQGRFQAFLRAKSEDRKKLLQQLFRTQRFADVEQWLRERRIALRRRSDEVHQLVADVISRASEATDTPLPDGWDIQDLTLPAGAGELAGWLTELQASVKEQHDVEVTDAADAASMESESRSRLEEAKALAARRARVASASEEHADLLAGAEEHRLSVALVEAAGRAARVQPVASIAERARAQRDAAVAAAPASDDPAAALATARASLTSVSDDLAAARALLPVQDRLCVIGHQVTELDAERVRLAEELERAEERRTALPDELAALRTELAEARRAELRLPTLRARVEAHARTEELSDALVEARARHAQAKEQALAARERVLDVRQARLEGMAAELAGGLAVGASCPVCGSAEHPHKATPAAGAPDADAERQAQREADDASSEEHARAGHVRDLETRLDLARKQRGGDADRDADRDADDADDAADEGVETLEEDLDRALALAARLSDLERSVAAAEQSLDSLGRTLERLSARSSEVEATLRHLAEERGRLSERLTAALEGTDADDIAALVKELEGRCTSLRGDVERIDAAQRAEAALAEAETSLATACESAGFPDVEAALDAVLDETVVDDLTARIKHHDRRLAAVTAVLAETGAEEVLAQPEPDVSSLAEIHRAALDTLGAAQAALDRCVHRLARITALRKELADHLTLWEPLRAELELTSRLAQFAEGKGADNQLQMSLSAYVVAYRLTQVVAAANERLAAMSDRRYSLEHSVRRGAGDRRGGLSLMVRDDWSGEARDPATLSGGETFVVSLALALGLADVITHEAGGAMLDTLFVDEGFGSLDADTLDDVMDVLDGLRDGGRVVGVVSHVAEMRDRIPAQLRVTKQRTGSALAIAGA